MAADVMDAAAEMWIGWYRLARKGARQAATPFHRVQASFWGFARTRGEALQQVLIRQLQSNRLTDCTVERPDPDTLTVTSPWLDFSQTCLPSGLSRLFADQEFVRLPMMLRFTVAEYGKKPGGNPVARRTFVLCGQWDTGRLIVKAVWPASTFGSEDRIYRLAPWRLEARFLEDLNFYCHTGELRSGWKTEFVSQGQARTKDRFLRSVRILPGQPKLRVFLRQAMLFLVILTTGLCLLPFVRFHEAQVPLGGALIGGGAWGLFYIIHVRLRVIALRHAAMQRAFKQLHARPLKFVPVNLVDLGAQDDLARQN
jgi:hypothetical protein